MEERDTNLVSFFSALGDSADVFRFFGRGGNGIGFIVLGCWATRVAQQYIKSSAVVKNWGTTTNPIHAVVVNEALSREIIRDCLLHLSTSVEGYDKTGSSYKRMQHGTPGNIGDFEATLFEFGDAEIQLLSCGALTVTPAAGGQLHVGLAVLNTTLRTFFVAEFDDVHQLVNLDSHVTQLNLRELLVTPNMFTPEFEASFRRMCERSNVTITTLPVKPQRSSTTIDAVQRRIAAFLRVPEERMILCELTSATTSLGVLLDHTKMSTEESGTDGDDSTGSYVMKQIISSTFLKLDAAAIHALNLVAQGQQEAPRGRAPTTIYAWLNRCMTGMGARLMRQWLLQPLRDAEAISDRHSLLEVMVESPVVRDSLCNQVLRRCSDMDRLNRKLQRRNISLKELSSYVNFAGSVASAVQCLKLYSGQHSRLVNNELITPLEELCSHLANMKILIEYSIDVADRETRIKPEFDDDLNVLEQQRQSVSKDIDKEYNAAMRKYGWNDKQLKYEQHPSYGYVFRVSRKDDQQVRDSKELTTVNTAKDGVRFMTDKLSALNNQHKSVQKAYETRQQDLKKTLIDTAASYLPVLDDSKELIAQIDVFVAWSLVVKDSPRPMVRPIMRNSHLNSKNEEQQNSSSSGFLNMVNVRHPLVEARQPDYIGNSVKLAEGSNAYIITGPNMGGKSTYMRSVAVAVVLAQAGCFIPADHAEISVRDAVMCRVGATDHLSQGVSTFMVEMLESAAILSTATKNSLVVVDELGRGTSTYDGFGLAWAIADHVANTLKSSLLFSTHFHEMTDMESVSPNIRNMHFGASVSAAGGLRFTYQLEPGPCERSYGIHVAELAKLPAEVVAEAKRKADELESFAGETEQWRRASLSESVQQRIGEYVVKMKAVCDAGADENAVAALRAAIMADSEIAQLLGVGNIH
ncbi:mismatch repair protein, putative [Bodo saltans]|uniref:Mismatch repair protein, putative n=1 Tax=Bodo saltans TaxID=75058 RepID=A0A0S4J224_BODSA|nr:mismatch repair protein, putative [Bodo saltans]|eukprot:CUG15657.1 mismatch repair protein, putative [Bodo saltans]